MLITKMDLRKQYKEAIMNFCKMTILLTLLNSHVKANNKWCPRVCECYHEFETVDCSRRSLENLPEVSNLTKRLYAENNNIGLLNDNLLQNLTRLLVLNIPSNSLSKVTSHTFCGLERVMEINLTQNQIESFLVGRDTICELSHLQILRLEYNHLSTIPYNLSMLAPNLHLLYLGYNEIHYATLDSSFAAFRRLQTLDLRGNPIHEIGSHDLEPLTSLSLKSLNLQDCATTYIHEHALRPLFNSSALVLSENSLLLPQLEKAFRNIGNDSRLTKLDISQMSFTTINNSNLCMFPELTILDISFSSVSYIDPELFNSLPNLQVLNVQGNFIKSIDGVQNLSNVTQLFLQNNKIRDIHLESLQHLEIVDLSGNQLQQLPTGWLAKVDNINVLNISNNRLTTINYGAFQKVSLHILDVSHNQLTRLHRYGAFKITNLYMSHNNLSLVTDSAFDNLEPYIEELDLSFNKFRQFPMLIKRDFLALQSLNLAHNNLGDAIAKEKLGGLFESLRHLQVLDLSFNQITSIPKAQMGKLHHLTTLQLQENLIKHLDDLGINQLQSLAKLVLSQNQISTVDTSILADMTYLEILDLSYNPYDCSCNLLPFQLWLNRTFVRIVDIKQNTAYQCTSPESHKYQYVLTTQPDMSTCPHQSHNTMSKIRLKVIAISFITVLIFGVCIFMLCYYCNILAQVRTLRYHWQVRYREVSVQGAECAVDPCDADCDNYAFDEIEVGDSKGLILINQCAQDSEN